MITKIWSMMIINISIISKVVSLGIRSRPLRHFSRTNSFIQTMKLRAHTFCLAEANGLMARIEENNNLQGKHLSKDFLPFTVQGKTYGYVTPDFANICAQYPAFTYDNGAVMLSDSLNTPEKRTNAILSINRDMCERNIIKGWREEMLPVVEHFSSEPIFLIERAAYSYFGAKGYGVHVNGYVRGEEGEVVKLWVARRTG